MDNVCEDQSLVYLEVITDQELGSAGVKRCSAHTLLHEIGHQLGLEDFTGGFMLSCVFDDHKHFTDSQLATIRTK